MEASISKYIAGNDQANDRANKTLLLLSVPCQQAEMSELMMMKIRQ